MKRLVIRLLVASALALPSFVLTGCGAKEEAAAPAPEATAEQAAAEGEEPPQEAEESTTDTVVIDMSEPASPADYDAAVKKKDFVRATDVVLRMNAQSVPGGDTMNRMRELQDEVARAAANGDPKAKQAAEMLRRIGRMPPPAAAAAR